MENQPMNSTTIPDPSTTAQQPTPSPTEKPQTLPKNATRIQQQRFLLRYLACAGRTTDRTLVRLSKLLSTPNGTDVLLCTTSYTLTLIHALLSRVLERKLANIATDIAEKVDGVLLPGETLVAHFPAPTGTKLLAQIVGSSKGLAATITDYRIFVRLWGCVGLYTWARGTYYDPLPETASKKDKALRKLTWAAIASSIGFQVLENGAYLSSKGVLTSAGWLGEAGKARENKWWIWSSRFWAAYVGVELARLGVIHYYYHEDDVLAEQSGDGEKEDKLRRQERIRARKLESWAWWKDFASNMAYAPMTLHWSSEQGLLSDWGVSACGMMAGGALLTDAWSKTV